jgi:hypothetical protein
MYRQDNSEINTLAELNAELLKLTNRNDGSYTVPLTAGAFDQTLGPSEDEISGVIKNSNEQVYDWIDVSDLVASIDADIATALADPQGYEAKSHDNNWAYINDGGYALNDQAYNLLVDAAHNEGNARHHTGNARNAPRADGYVHLYGDNTLYAFTDDPPHRGYPKVTVVADGSVSDGQHNF